jgi:hypothetical protein
LEDKIAMADRKLQEKNTRWQALREDERHKASIEERRVLIGEQIDGGDYFVR